MKKLLKKFGVALMAVMLAVGTTTTMTGCDDDDDPIEETGDEIEDATD